MYFAYRRLSTNQSTKFNNRSRRTPSLSPRTRLTTPPSTTRTSPNTRRSTNCNNSSSNYNSNSCRTTSTSTGSTRSGHGPRSRTSSTPTPTGTANTPTEDTERYVPRQRERVFLNRRIKAGNVLRSLSLEYVSRRTVFNLHRRPLTIVKNTAARVHLFISGPGRNARSK